MTTMIGALWASLRIAFGQSSIERSSSPVLLYKGMEAAFETRSSGTCRGPGGKNPYAQPDAAAAFGSGRYVNALLTFDARCLFSPGLLGLMVALDQAANAPVAHDSPVSIQSLPRRGRSFSSPAHRTASKR
jgi:hypothetical protein